MKEKLNEPAQPRLNKAVRRRSSSISSFPAVRLLFMWLFQQIIMCETTRALGSSDLVLIARMRAHATRRHKYAADARALTVRLVNNPIPFLQSWSDGIFHRTKMVHENNIVRAERFQFQPDDCERSSVLFRADHTCGRKSQIESFCKCELMHNWTSTHIWSLTRAKIGARAVAEARRQGASVRRSACSAFLNHRCWIKCVRQNKKTWRPDRRG